MVLREHSNSESVVNEAVTLKHLQFSLHCFQQSGLSSSVWPYKSDSRFLIDVQVDSVDDDFFSLVSNASFIKSEHWWRKLFRVREYEDTAGIMDDLLYYVHPLNALDPRLDESSPCSTVSELINELLDVGDLVLL